MSDILDTAIQQEETDEQLEAEREGEQTLNDKPKSKVARLIKRRWDRLEPVAKRKQTELKVNYLRYSGNQFAQVNPRDPNRILVPRATDTRSPPTLNKLRRAVHHYTAQTTADEPVIEAVPASHSEADRDASEAATHALQGEWHRLKLQREFERAAQICGIFRSAFWFFEWDDTAGGRTKAQKFFTDPNTNERRIEFVDSDGNPVDDPDDAATIWKGNATVEVMTPMNVRWTGGRYAHEADELMVAKVVRLRSLYEAFPKTRKMKLDKLLGDLTPEAEKWLQDIRGENYRSGLTLPDDVNLEDVSGKELEDDDSLLDQPVLLLHYFLPQSRRYPKGFHGIIAGNMLLHRGDLRYGVMPLAHFKLMDEVSEPLGIGLVDILKDPQELLDFVRGQILRHLQMMRRRWFLPQQANVSARDLMNPDRTVIKYNARAGKPEAETQPELSSGIFTFMDKAQEDFDDLWGIHETARGKHVPGVSSGRHAEALRSGDETLLGLTRTQFKIALEQAGLVILRMVKKEWTTERRVRYQGEGRQYIDKAFDRTDFRDTADVRLKPSTLLMLTKAQRLETIFGYAEMGVLDPQELRRLAPLADTAGLSLSEDEHVMRARRQNERFLTGPNDEAEAAWEDFQAQMQRLETQLDHLMSSGAVSQLDEPLAVTLQQEMDEAQANFDGVMSRFLPSPGPADQLPNVAVLHVEEHARALASEKAERLPSWWVDWFAANHFELDLQAASPPDPEAEQGVDPLTGEQAAVMTDPMRLPNSA